VRRRDGDKAAGVWRDGGGGHDEWRDGGMTSGGITATDGAEGGGEDSLATGGTECGLRMDRGLTLPCSRASRTAAAAAAELLLQPRPSICCLETIRTIPILRRREECDCPHHGHVTGHHTRQTSATTTGYRPPGARDRAISVPEEGGRSRRVASVQSSLRSPHPGGRSPSSPTQGCAAELRTPSAFSARTSHHPRATHSPDIHHPSPGGRSVGCAMCAGKWKGESGRVLAEGMTSLSTRFLPEATRWRVGWACV